MSKVRLFGRFARPGFGWLRAAVGSYLFQISAMTRRSFNVFDGTE
jgi:hypothetical protein